MTDEAPDSTLQKIVKDGKDRAKIMIGFGTLIFIFSSLAALGGSSDATVIECTRGAPDSTVDCAVVNSFLGMERMRLDIPDVVATSYRHHQPTRGKIVYVETPKRDDIYLETTEEEAFRQLSAFLDDKSRKRFEWKEEPPAVFNVVAIAFGLLLGLFGLFKWRSWGRKRFV